MVPPILVFSPNETRFKAGPQLCLCDKCKVEFGFCELFSSHHLQIQELISIRLRSEVAPPPKIVGEYHVDEFILPNSVVAVAVDANSIDIIWFLKVVETNRVLFKKKC